MKLPSRVRPLVLGLSAAAAVTISTPSPALAGNCTMSVLCGRVKHHPGSSATSLRVTGNFGDPWSSVQSVSRGNEATFKDDDGYFIPYGWKARQAQVGSATGWSRWLTRADTVNGWRKVNDLQNVTVQLVRA